MPGLPKIATHLKSDVGNEPPTQIHTNMFNLPAEALDVSEGPALPEERVESEPAEYYPNYY